MPNLFCDLRAGLTGLDLAGTTAKLGVGAGLRDFALVGVGASPEPDAEFDIIAITGVAST